MRDKIKYTLLGVLLTALVGFGLERSIHTYLWAGQVNMEAKSAYQYLAQPVARDKSGKPITRAQVLDQFVQFAVERSSQPKTGPSPSSNKN